VESVTQAFWKVPDFRGLPKQGDMGAEVFLPYLQSHPADFSTQVLVQAFQFLGHFRGTKPQSAFAAFPETPEPVQTDLKVKLPRVSCKFLNPECVFRAHLAQKQQGQMQVFCVDGTTFKRRNPLLNLNQMIAYAFVREQRKKQAPCSRRSLRNRQCAL